MIHLLMAVVDYEGRDPVRAFTALDAAEAFLAVVQAHQCKRPSVLDDEGGDWESRTTEWQAQHPAPGHAYVWRCDIVTAERRPDRPGR